MMTNTTLHLRVILKGILIFWAVWYSFVTVSDLLNILIHQNIITEDLTFNSKNFELMLGSFSVYGIGINVFTIFCFIIIIIWSGLAAIFYWYAVFGPSALTKAVLAAFILSMSQDAFFIFSDELFLQYTVEDGHMKRLGVKALSLVLFIQCDQKLNPMKNK